MDRFTLHDAESSTQLFTSSSVKETYEFINAMLKQDGLAGLEGLVLYDEDVKQPPYRDLRIALYLHDLMGSGEPMDKATA